MKNKNRGGKWLMLLSVTMLILASCIHESIIPSSTGISAKMAFNIATKRSKAGVEDEVKRMDILFFQEGVLEKISKNITTFTQTPEGKTLVEIGFATEGTRDAYVVVNTDNTEWLDLLQPGVATEDDLKAIESKVLTKMAEAPFIMSGTKRGLVISENASTTECLLTRAVARIDVKIAEGSNFTLSEARLINAKKTAYLFSPGTPGSGAVGDLNLISIKDDVITLYSYENSVKDLATATTVEVTGTAADGKPLTYIVDFSDDTQKPIAIERNTHYTVTLGSVQSNNISATIKVKDWLIGGNIEYDYEGSLPITNVVIDPAVGTYNAADSTITLNWAAGEFTLNVMANAECAVEIDGTWIKLLPETRAATGVPGKFVFQFPSNTSNVENKGTVRVTNKLNPNSFNKFKLTHKFGKPVGYKEKVIVVGDDFVYGNNISNREKNNLSAYLGYALGDQFVVRNFGAVGATAIKLGNKPYTSTPEYANSLKEVPDYVVILLGTNDTRLTNVSKIGNYKSDLLSLVNTYKSLANGPKIILAKPPRCFAISGEYGQSNSTLTNRVIPDIEAIAQETGASIVDYNSLFVNTGAKYLSDGVFLTSMGYADIGMATYTAITGYGFDENLKPIGKWINPAITAMPSGEFRSEAGWVPGNDWHTIADEITTVLQGRELRLLLLGNSITQAFGGSRRTRITTFAGNNAFRSFYGSQDWEQAGISGDRTQNLLWRLKNGHYDGCIPRKVIITIGINNIGNGKQSGEDTADGIYACAVEAAKLFPKADIVLYGTLPKGRYANDAHRIEHNNAHAKLATMTMPSNVRYVNLTSQFTNADGTLKTELYNGDYLHLNEAGYMFWAPLIVRQ